ncbi:transcriptional regulator IbrB [Escherichia coli]|uniref:Transcriptional regulator IbrB n=1 Tax=Escherichia coli TaxID=562 RepID=A0A376L2G0_ECOLX|nr:transcriptional regulator IbrB [Escherichia coli]
MKSVLLPHEPVDCVLWVKADEVVANDYNPNVMAPGEKKLLKQSTGERWFHTTGGGV